MDGYQPASAARLSAVVMNLITAAVAEHTDQAGALPAGSYARNGVADATAATGMILVLGLETREQTSWSSEPRRPAAAHRRPEG